MSRIVIVGYRPKPDKGAELRELLRTHVPRLREFGFVTDRPPVLMEAADGSYVEVFEWVSMKAIDKPTPTPRSWPCGRSSRRCATTFPSGGSPIGRSLRGVRGRTPGMTAERRCPACGSENLRLDRLERMTESISLLVRIPFAVGRNRWVCEDCDHRFRGQRTTSQWLSLFLVLPLVGLWYVVDLLLHGYRQFLAGVRSSLGLARGQMRCWSCKGALEGIGERCPHCGIALPSPELYARHVDADREDYDGVCDTCRVPYCLADYDPAAETWLCSACGTKLPGMG